MQSPAKSLAPSSWRAKHRHRPRATARSDRIAQGGLHDALLDRCRSCRVRSFT